MPSRRGSWAGTGTQGATNTSGAARRWSAAAAAVTAGSSFLPLQKGKALAHFSDVGLTRTIYRESRKVLARQLHARGSRHWKLKDVCQAVLEGAKVAITMYRIVEILQNEVVEGRARRDAAARIEAQAKADAAAKAEAEAKARELSAQSTEARESRGADIFKEIVAGGKGPPTMMQNISQVVHELRNLGAPVCNTDIDEIMKLCQDISCSLLRFADMMKSGLEALTGVSVTLDEHAHSLAGLVGRLKDEMVRLHAALQVAADMKQDALDRDSFESALAERRAEVQATVNARRELRKAWQQQHKDERERQQTEEQLQREGQDHQVQRSNARRKTLSRSEQVINQLDQLEQALLNSPANVARPGAIALFGFDSPSSTSSTQMEQIMERQSSGGTNVSDIAMSDAVSAQGEANSSVPFVASDEIVKERRNSSAERQNSGAETDSLPLRAFASKESERHSTGSELDMVRSSSLPPEDRVQGGKARIQGQNAPTCNDENARPQSCVGSALDAAGKTLAIAVNDSLTLEGRHDTRSPLGSGDDELEESAEPGSARLPGKVLTWASSLIESPQEKKKNKARYTSDLPGRQNAAGFTGQDPSKMVSAVLSGHWRRVRTPPLQDGDGNEEKPQGSRAGSPLSTQTLATLRAGATARRPSVPDVVSACGSRAPSVQGRKGRSPPPESRPPRSARPQVGVVDLFSVANSRSRFASGNSTSSAQDSKPPMSARAACPPLPPGQHRRRQSSEGEPLSARQPKRPVIDSRHAEPQRSPSPEFDTVWKEAWNPELGAIGRAQRLQDEAWEDESLDQPARSEPLGPAQKAPSAASFHSNHSAPTGSASRQLSPRVLPPVAGAGMDNSRRARDSNRTAKLADLQSKRQAGAAGSKPGMLRRHSLSGGDRGTS